MPRQIIDTESSRPAYRRRLVVRWVAGVLAIALAAFVGWWLWKAQSHPVLNLAPVPKRLGSNPACLRREAAKARGSAAASLSVRCAFQRSNHAA
jgi:hypothetical protein